MFEKKGGSDKSLVTPLFLRSLKLNMFQITEKDQSVEDFDHVLAHGIKHGEP
ncbi:hypothetical protein [Enterococcus pingfangensis]|uniref:hypothetical protein n=1 Tax=Enterococcus pingfangensis TaxID=2559924 RepID=UPI001484ECF3|nr:hypothetical protein [Enterococcus pingfangensis]